MRTSFIELDPAVQQAAINRENEAEYERMRVKPEEVAVTRLCVQQYALSEDGRTARLRIRTPFEDQPKVEILVDAADLESVNDHRWLARRRGKKGEIHVYTRIRSKQVTLGRFVLGVAADPTVCVYYKDGNRLDGRRGNLQIHPRPSKAN